MEIANIKVSELRGYDGNAKIHTPEQIEHIANSIKEFGFRNPLLVDNGKNIVAGHGRLEAAKALGMKEVPCIYISDLTDEQIAAYRVIDNQTSLETGFDFDILKKELDSFDINMEQFGLKLDSALNDSFEKYGQHDSSGILLERYIVPPFSVLDSRSGYWQDRKNKWYKIIDKGTGRLENLQGDGMA